MQRERDFGIDEVGLANRTRWMKRRLRQIMEAEGVPGTVREDLRELLNTYELQIKGLKERIAELEEEIAVKDRDKSEMKESLDELLSLQKLSEAIRSTLSAEEVVEALIHLTEKILPVESCGAFLLEEDTGRLQAVGASKPSSLLSKAAAAQSGEGIMDWAISQGKPIVVPDMESLSNDMDASSERNFVIAPFVVGNRGIGVFLIYTSMSQQAFTRHTIELLSLLTSQAAVAIENARIYKALYDTHQALKASQAQLVYTSRLAAIGELATAVAHEVNNPLQIMLGYVQLILMQDYVREAERKRLNMVRSQIEHISSITNGLLKFAHREENGGQFEWMDVRELLMRLVVLTRHALLRDHIEMQVSVDPDLPLIMGQESRLQQALMNLISNAHHAMSEGGVLSIRAHSKDGLLEMCFSDTGTGIPEEHMPHIFEPFFTTKGERAAGLGLSVCREVVEMHKGRIRVESEVGRGTTFWIYLPLDAALSEEIKGVRGPRSNVQGPRSLRP